MYVCCRNITSITYFKAGHNRRLFDIFDTEFILKVWWPYATLFVYLFTHSYIHTISH
jgi:hypothetical protein